MRVFTPTLALLIAALTGMALLIGCGDEPEETETLLKPDNNTLIYSVAETKIPAYRGAPAAPQIPTAGTPTVTEVNYYKDWQLTKPLEGVVQPGTTIFTKVVFSEPMRHIVSDEANARPILFYVIGDKEVRYHIKPHGAGGENFQSGDSKPLDSGTNDYICKYTVQNDDAGMFTLKVGKYSVDTDGNTLTESYVDDTSLSLGPEPAQTEPQQEEPTAVPEEVVTQMPDVVEISHYSNGGLTKPLTESIRAGKTVFTKVVFSGDTPYHVADNASARPDIRYVIAGKEAQYDVLPATVRRSQVRSGDCKPIGEGTSIFLCRKAIPRHATGEFSVTITGSLFEGPSLMIETPEPTPQPAAEQSDPIQTEQQSDTVEHIPELVEDIQFPLRLEVEAAKAAGLVGNSPLVRAIRIADRINTRVRTLRTDYLSKHSANKFANEREGIHWYNQELARIYREETDWTIHVFDKMVDIYTSMTGQEIYDEHLESYWLHIELLRLAFEDPGESKETYLFRFEHSVYEKRVRVPFALPEPLIG